MKSLSKKRLPIKLAVLGSAVLACGLLFIPELAHAEIKLPTFTGVTATDPIGIFLQVAAIFIKGIVYLIFAFSFVAGAYVAITTLMKMVKDRDTAADLLGRLLASLAVVIICYWFLDQGEEAAKELDGIAKGTTFYYEVQPEKFKNWV